VRGRGDRRLIKDSDQNKVLAIAVELAPGIEGDEEKHTAIAAALYYHLRRLNSKLVNMFLMFTKLLMWYYIQLGKPDYFLIGIKHRYL